MDLNGPRHLKMERSLDRREPAYEANLLLARRARKERQRIFERLVAVEVERGRPIQGGRVIAAGLGRRPGGPVDLHGDVGGGDRDIGGEAHHRGRAEGRGDRHILAGVGRPGRLRGLDDRHAEGAAGRREAGGRGGVEPRHMVIDQVSRKRRSGAGEDIDIAELKREQRRLAEISCSIGIEIDIHRLPRHRQRAGGEDRAVGIHLHAAGDLQAISHLPLEVDRRTDNGDNLDPGHRPRGAEIEDTIRIRPVARAIELHRDVADLELEAIDADEARRAAGRDHGGVGDFFSFSARGVGEHQHAEGDVVDRQPGAVAGGVADEDVDVFTTEHLVVRIGKPPPVAADEIPNPR